MYIYRLGKWLNKTQMYLQNNSVIIYLDNAQDAFESCFTVQRFKE